MHLERERERGIKRYIKGLRDKAREREKHKAKEGGRESTWNHQAHPSAVKPHANAFMHFFKTDLWI